MHELMNISINISILVAAIAIFIVMFKSKHGDKLLNIIKFLSGQKAILWFSVIIFGLGIILYTIGFHRLEMEYAYKLDLNSFGDYLKHWFAVVPRAIIASFKMFVVMHDFARVSPELRQDTTFMALMSITHFLAAFITFIYIIKIIGFSLKASWDLSNYANRTAKNQHVHIFWDLNESSCLLAKNIHENHKNSTIVFVIIDKNDCECNSPKRATLSSIFQTLSINQSLLIRLNEIDAKIAHCQEGPAALKDESKILETLKLNKVIKIIKKSSRTNFYFLSDDETQNITAALNLFKDETLKELSSKNNSTETDSEDNGIYIYVHARKSADNEIFDHYSQYETASDENNSDKNNSHKNIKIKVLDSAYHSIQTLKQKIETLPVNFVDVDTSTGTVSSEFSSLILGFGETGQEAFKFLYEFASFIDINQNKTPFKCVAIDQNMNSMAGLIRQHMPLITESELSLVNAAIDSETYWSTIKNLIARLNYVVISIDNDILGLNTAVNLFKYALQHRNNQSPKLKIILRCYNRNYENKMTEVTEKLNKSVNGQNISISIFGTEKEIYTYENVCKDKIISEAKTYHWVYENKKKENAEKQWKNDFEGESAIKNHCSKSENPTRFHAIYDINRKMSQDISNSLHMTTKLTLMGISDSTPKSEIDKLINIVNTRAKETTAYKCDDETLKTKLTNLAITEHERWISAHKLMGFTYGRKKNFAKKQHPDMVPYIQLDEKTQSYDNNVVDTTIKLYN